MRTQSIDATDGDATFERHYRIGELSELWGLGRETIRKIVMTDPDVIKVRMGKAKKHTTYSVPASVAERLHRKLTAGG